MTLSTLTESSAAFGKARAAADVAIERLTVAAVSVSEAELKGDAQEAELVELLEAASKIFTPPVPT